MELFGELAEATKPVKLNFYELPGDKTADEPKKKTEIEVLEEKTKNLKVAPDFKINNEAEYDLAIEKLKNFTALDKEVHVLVDPVCESTNKAHKDATGLKSKLLKPITTIKEAYQRAIGAYDFEKEKKAKAAAAKLEKERQDKIDALRIEEAEKLEEAGEPEKAQEVLDIQVDLAPIVIEKVKVAGLQYRDNWQAEVTDKTKIPMEYLIPDLSALTKHAKEIAASTKRKNENAEVVSDIPGVKFVNLRKAIV